MSSSGLAPDPHQQLLKKQSQTPTIIIIKNNIFKLDLNGKKGGGQTFRR